MPTQRNNTEEAALAGPWMKAPCNTHACVELADVDTLVVRDNLLPLQWELVTGLEIAVDNDFVYIRQAGSSDDQSVLAYTKEEWTAFLDGCKNGDLDQFSCKCPK
jgi:hypothetical protein